MFLSKDEQRSKVLLDYPFLVSSIEIFKDEIKLIRKPLINFKQESVIHPNNRGENISYSRLHKWVREKRGNPLKCEHCSLGVKKQGRSNIQWANISHQYKRDLNDWIALCCRCHKKYDMGVYKII